MNQVDQDQIWLSDLLPLSLHDSLNPATGGRRLVYARFLNLCAIRAIESFLNGELRSFDALVGDTGCHKRAVPLAEIFRHLRSNPRFRAELTLIVRRARKILGRLNALRKAERDCACLALREFFHKAEIDIRISADVRFLILSYLLTVTKLEQDAKDITLSDRLKTIVGGLIVDECVQIVAEAQAVLSSDSLNRLQHCIVALPTAVAQHHEDMPLLKLMSGQDFQKKDAANRVSTPCFFEVKALLLHQVLHGRPLVIRVRFGSSYHNTDTDSMSLAYLAENGQYRRVDPACLDYNDCTVVIEGHFCPGAIDKPWKTEFLERVDDHSIVDLALATAASHPQYHGIHRTSVVGHSGAMKEIEKYASMADQLGCSRENPRLFVVYHIFTAAICEVFADSQLRVAERRLRHTA